MVIRRIPNIVECFTARLGTLQLIPTPPPQAPPSVQGVAQTSAIGRNGRSKLSRRVTQEPRAQRERGSV